MKQSKKQIISIIGKGKLGSSLFRALKESGKYEVYLAAENSTTPINTNIINQSELIFICTQDRKISDVVKVLFSAKFNLKGKIIYHTSGSLLSDLLKKLKIKGASTASFHPIQTFAFSSEKSLFRNIFIAVEGSTRAVKTASTIAKSLGAETFIVKKDKKILNHINCVIASNFLCTLMANLKPLPGKNKLKYYKELSLQSINNIFSRGAVESLTGPFERSDLNTIISHINYLKKNKRLLRFYLFMGIETAKIALEKKSISTEQFESILREFEKIS